MQLQEALQGFLLQLSADGRSPHTIGQYRRHVTTLIDWVERTGHGSDVVDLTPELLAGFFADGAAKNSCRGGPKKAVSLNAMRTSVRCFCAHLHDAGLVAANPARPVLTQSIRVVTCLRYCPVVCSERPSAESWRRNAWRAAWSCMTWTLSHDSAALLKGSLC